MLKEKADSQAMKMTRLFYSFLERKAVRHIGFTHVCCVAKCRLAF